MLKITTAKSQKTSKIMKLSFKFIRKENFIILEVLFNLKMFLYFTSNIKTVNSY